MAHDLYSYVSLWKAVAEGTAHLGPQVLYEERGTGKGCKFRGMDIHW